MFINAKLEKDKLINKKRFHTRTWFTNYTFRSYIIQWTDMAGSDKWISCIRKRDLCPVSSRFIRERLVRIDRNRRAWQLGCWCLYRVYIICGIRDFSLYVLHILWPLYKPLYKDMLQAIKSYWKIRLKPWINKCYNIYILYKISGGITGRTVYIFHDIN